MIKTDVCNNALFLLLCGAIALVLLSLCTKLYIVALFARSLKSELGKISSVYRNKCMQM